MKPRSPGQRQFNPMGTERDWQKVAESPHVQRMLRDPSLRDALYQNFRQSGGQVPQPPMRMQTGGLPTPEEVNRIDQMRGGEEDPATREQLQQLAQDTRMADGGLAMDDADEMNEIAQELNDPETTPARKQTLRNKLAQLGRAPRIQMPPAMERARGGVMRFADGGQNAAAMEELQQEMADANAAYMQASNNQDYPGMKAATKKQADIQARISRLNMAQAAPSPPPASSEQSSASPSAPGTPAAPAASAAGSPQGVSLGPNLNISGSTLSNLQKLTGPMTPGNEVASVLGGALLGGGGGSGAGALIGGATAGLLNFFIRKHNQQQQQNAQKQMQSPANGAQNYSATSNAVGDSPNISNAGGARPSQTNSQGETQVPSAEAWKSPTYNPAGGKVQDDSSSSSASSTPPSGPGLWSGTYSGGNATSSNGQDWTDVKTGNPISGPVINQTQIGAFGGGDQTVPADAEGLLSLPTTSYVDAGSLSPLSEDGMAKGGPVKKAHGIAAIPVLHVMIAAVPKGKKKAMGGNIPQSERKPLKPKAVPPLAGPQYGGRPLPHGRVQVPRGSGAAIKGKRFGGIY